ncbi:MAG: carbon monoxide dehydrogenase subunit G [Anaerolineae bacterium]|nr:carbon monoxide dehydrogenase subunit G [Anaerolineae bacterium]
MKLEGTYTFEAPRDEVWKALMDPEVLKSIMPGCEKLEPTGPDEYKAALKIKVGPVQGKFQGNVKLSDINEPESYTMQVDGKGPAGFMKGTGAVRLEDQGDSTVIHYDGDAQVGGKIASVGQRLLDSSAKALTKQSLDGLHDQIKARSQPQDSSSNGSTTTSSPPPPPKAPSQAEFAIGVAKNMVEDMIPPERRPMVIAGGLGTLGLLVILKWWIGAIARKAARRELERRGY